MAYWVITIINVTTIFCGLNTTVIIQDVHELTEQTTVWKLILSCQAVLIFINNTGLGVIYIGIPIIASMTFLLIIVCFGAIFKGLVFNGYISQRVFQNTNPINYYVIKITLYTLFKIPFCFSYDSHTVISKGPIFTSCFLLTSICYWVIQDVIVFTFYTDVIWVYY